MSPCKDDGVLGLDELAPVAFQPLHIAVPAGKTSIGLEAPRERWVSPSTKSAIVYLLLFWFSSSLTAQCHLRDLSRVDDGAEPLGLLAQDGETLRERCGR